MTLTVDGCGLNNETHHELLPKKTANGVLAIRFTVRGVLPVLL